MSVSIHYTTLNIKSLSTYLDEQQSITGHIFLLCTTRAHKGIVPSRRQLHQFLCLEAAKVTVPNLPRVDEFCNIL